MATEVAIDIDTTSMDSYRRFLKIKRLPQYRVGGRTAYVPAEYAHLIGESQARKQSGEFTPSPFLFDYQRDISSIAIRKRKFAVFMEPGRGKTLIDFEFAHHAVRQSGKRILIVSPLMVVDQMAEEHERFYGHKDHSIETVPARRLSAWINSDGPAIGITNYDGINDSTSRGNLGGLILSESSMLKSAYGKWGNRLIDIGRGLEWKLCETGTPAPNDRIEYANHAVFLDHVRSPNEFYAKYFVNRGQTNERWVIKPHALRPFYRDLSHWCIFVSNPAVYGWKDGTDSIPPMHIHIEHIELSGEQRKAVQSVTGGLFAKNSGGITQRGKLSRIGKGNWNGESLSAAKPDWIVQNCAAWASEGRSSIVWCKFNDEQDALAERFGEAAVSVQGSTDYEARRTMIQQFKTGEKKILISKPKVLGFGLNLQIATRHVFSTLMDSYEEFYQAIKRSNRIGSTEELHVYLPVTEIESPMIDTVLRKADRVQQDTEEQERLFKEFGHAA
jgi:hypothetical protein